MIFEEVEFQMSTRKTQWNPNVDFYVNADPVGGNVYLRQI